ncbi:MAG TPA: hypothetical protein VFE58_06720 [Tepidisphaeraceae bacterium]|jgi:hypothetical protein|nr:hypothetical protein [Tepidisphaeraceae bacterium]
MADVASLHYASPPPAPPAVQGTLIGRSASKTVVMLGVNALLFVFGAFLVWAKMTGLTLDAGSQPKQVTWWGYLIGMAGVLLTPVACYRLLRAFWVRERLVIGADRLQVIERRPEGDAVTLQIPYKNIADVRYETTSSDRRVSVTLHDVNDPATYALRPRFRETHEATGRHLHIGSGYRSGPREIAAALQGAFVAWGGRLSPDAAGSALLRSGPTTSTKVLSVVAVITCLVPGLGLVLAVGSLWAARGTEGWPKKLNLLSLILAIVMTSCVALLWVIGR